MGLYALAQKLLTGVAGEAWNIFCLSFCLVLALAWIIERRPMTHEAIFRVAGAPPWQEISPWRRFFLMLLDWPLFSEIREREVDRLRNQPLIRAGFEADYATLEPIEAQHYTRFFLRRIACAATGHGIKALPMRQGLLPRDSLGSSVIMVVSTDAKIAQYLTDNFLAGELYSLQEIRKTLEYAYLSTLSEDERYLYMWENR
jgi:hypothetical protein